MHLSCHQDLASVAPLLRDVRFAVVHPRASQTVLRAVALIASAWMTEELSEYMVHWPSASEIDTAAHRLERADAVLDAAGIAAAAEAGDILVFANRAERKPFCLLSGYEHGGAILVAYAAALKGGESVGDTSSAAWRFWSACIWGPERDGAEGFERWSHYVRRYAGAMLDLLPREERAIALTRYVDAQTRRGRNVEATWFQRLVAGLR